MSPADQPSCGRYVAAAVLASALSVGTVAAQALPAATPAPGRVMAQPFAWPWELSIEHIRRAMAGASYRVDQVRRVLDRSTPTRPDSWIRIRERLRHVAETPQAPERFQLEMLGVENHSLTAFELQLRASRFAANAEFVYRYQSFRVADGALAAENYAVTLLGISTRLGEPVYRIAITSVVGPRSAWCLELSLRTGYPLYRAEYDVGGRLVGEVEVTSYDPAFSGTDLPRRPNRHAEQAFADAHEAVESLGLSTAGVPGPEVLPRGYEPLSAKVVTDALSGEKKAVLTYSDGIDQIFVTVAGDQGHLPRDVGHVVGVHQDAVGVTQCLFAHSGVQYVVIGRGADEPVRHVAHVLYSQVVR